MNTKLDKTTIKLLKSSQYSLAKTELSQYMRR